MMWINKKLNKKGFTIIELIVVMAVLAILVTMGVPKYLNYTKDANVTAMKTDAKILENAALQYHIANEIDAADDASAWPVGDEYEIEDTTISGFLSDATANEIDEDAVEGFVRSTKNSVDSYFIVTEGEYEGCVFSKNIFEDSKGNEWSGLSCLNAEEGTEG